MQWSCAVSYAVALQLRDATTHALSGTLIAERN